MIIPKHTPIIVNGKIIGAVAEDCTDEKKTIPVNVFLTHFEAKKFQNIYGEKELLSLTATFSVPLTEDENF